MTEPTALAVQGNWISPAASMQQAKERYQAVKDFIESILVEGTDYGTVPGSDKKVLLKPGAEKMTSFFGFTVRFILADKAEDWTGEAHGGEAFFYYRYVCQLWRGEQLVAEGEGSCNSWERKYRYRKAERVCPQCGTAAIIKGKEEYGGGWLCWKKHGGCGAKYLEGDPEIESQEAGQIKNEDPADQVNTYLKMAQKRALIAPVLIATNTSDRFTQDIDDYIDGTVTEAGPNTTQGKLTSTATGAPQGNRTGQAGQNRPGVHDPIKKDNMPPQPSEHTMKASSTEAVAIFERETTLATTEAAKTLLAHFKGGMQVTEAMIVQYARQWAGLIDENGNEIKTPFDGDPAIDDEMPKDGASLQ